MALICTKLDADSRNNKSPSSSASHVPATVDHNVLSMTSRGDALQVGDYRDILSLTRVLVYGPQSKADIDLILERYAILLKTNRLVSSKYYPPSVSVV